MLVSICGDLILLADVRLLASPVRNVSRNFFIFFASTDSIRLEKKISYFSLHILGTKDGVPNLHNTVRLQLRH